MPLQYPRSLDSAIPPTPTSVVIAIGPIFITYIYCKLPILVPKTGPERPKEILDALEKMKTFTTLELDQTKYWG